jgi:hypothetical protein
VRAWVSNDSCVPGARSLGWVALELAAGAR